MLSVVGKIDGKPRTVKQLSDFFGSFRRGTDVKFRRRFQRVKNIFLKINAAIQIDANFFDVGEMR